MMTISIRNTGFYMLLLCCLLVSPAVHSEQTVDDEMQLGISAIPIRRSAPKYPRSESDRGRQGWVDLSYVVTKDGRVVDPVIENSSGSRSFEKAALRTVEDWAYKPASWNGEPVQQCETSVRLVFAMDGAEKKVSKQFYATYRRIDKLLVAGDLDAAGELLDETLESFDMTLPELGWYWALRARHAGQLGDNKMQLVALRKATAGGDKWLPEGLYPGLLLVRTVRELEISDYSSALNSYDKLLKTGSDMPQIENLRPAIEKIEAMLASDTVYAVPGRIPGDASCTDCDDNWRYRLLRNKFSFAAVDGKLDKLEIRCPWRRVVDEAREGVSWSIPQSWGSCSVFVFGDPGASFSLLEEPGA